MMCLRHLEWTAEGVGFAPAATGPEIVHYEQITKPLSPQHEMVATGAT